MKRALRIILRVLQAAALLLAAAISAVSLADLLFDAGLSEKLAEWSGFLSNENQWWTLSFAALVAALLIDMFISNSLGAPARKKQNDDLYKEIVEQASKNSSSNGKEVIIHIYSKDDNNEPAEESEAAAGNDNAVERDNNISVEYENVVENDKINTQDSQLIVEEDGCTASGSADDSADSDEISDCTEESGA